MCMLIAERQTEDVPGSIRTQGTCWGSAHQHPAQPAQNCLTTKSNTLPWGWSLLSDTGEKRHCKSSETKERTGRQLPSHFGGAFPRNLHTFPYLPVTAFQIINHKPFISGMIYGLHDHKKKSDVDKRVKNKAFLFLTLLQSYA